MAFWSRRVERAVPHAEGVLPPLRDPALAEYLGYGSRNSAGVSVTETSALGVTAVYRCVSLIAGTVAGLSLKSYRDTDAGREEVSSFLDDPGGDLFTPFEFVQLVMVHLLLHGNAFLLHVYTEGGSLAALWPIHPSMVHVKWDHDAGEKIFQITVDGRTEDYTAADVTHVMGFSTDGLVGISPIRACRGALGTAIAGDDAAGSMFANGLMVGGIVTPDEDMNEVDAKVIKAGLDAKMSGTANAGGLAFINRSLKISPWTMNAEDAQFIESRQFGVSEVARIYGVPVQMLAQDGASSWGSGIQELVNGWVKFTLRNWTTPVEQKLSALLSNPRFVEFDYKSLLQGTPQEEVPLLIAQVEAGLLTADEARAIMNLPPLTASEKEEINPPLEASSPPPADAPTPEES